MASITRYDDIGTVSAVKLIPKIDSYNGYIRLYTERDSHIEVGDTVFITYSGDTSTLGDFDLDNLYYVSFTDENFYNNYAQGYDVLYVNKNNNSFVIDRQIISIPKNSRADGYFVSTFVADKTNIFDGVVDGALLKNSVIDPVTYDDVNLTQAVVFGGEINNLTKCSKYPVNYISLLLNYNEDDDTFIKYSNLNNNGYGYSYFYDILDNSSYNGIRNCNFFYGNYFNCDISSVDLRFIKGGYYYQSYIDNYEIYDGYFHDLDELTNSCVWLNGKWDGGVFTLGNWTNGSFISGTFGNNDDAVWENGTFFDGVWAGRFWINGNFSGGIFKGQDSVYESGQITYTEWLDGNFIDGKMLNTDFYLTGTTGIGNSFYVKNINVSGGELYSASINSGKITGGDFYDCSIKNANICDGDFIANEENLDYQYNRLANCTIYGGNFLGEWWKPTYDLVTSAFTSSVYGLNEICDSTIYGGEFRYTHFHNNNLIKKGDFDNCLFFSPIEVENGKFYGKKKNKIYYSDGSVALEQLSTYFKSEEVNLSKCKLRSKTVLTTSNTLKDILYLEFDNGHNFTESDAGKTVQLVGFNSQELWNSEYTIMEEDTYYDPTSYSSLGGYQFFKPIGQSYIALDGAYYSWYYGDSGMVRKFDDFDRLSEPNHNDFNIYDGIFTNCYMSGVESAQSISDSLSGTTRYGNFKIHNGIYNNCDMRNGMMWYNGIFDGGTFFSNYLDIECNWYNGNFYSGLFGNNRGGVLDNITLSIWYNGAQIIERSGATGPIVESNDEYRIKEIYPLSYNSSDSFVGPVVLPSLPNSVNSAFGLTSFLPDINTFNGNLPAFSDDSAKQYMNLEVWSNDSVGINKKYSPYEFIFAIECSSEEARVKISKMLEVLSDSLNTTSDYYGAVISPTNPGTTNVEPFLTFESLFGVEHRIIDYRVGTNMVYVLVEFDKIKEIFENSTNSELMSFYKNFRNVWSIANTGYYTYPMPVKYPSNHNSTLSVDDLDEVGKFVIYGDSSTIEDSKWIYGTCPPPWWYEIPIQVGVASYINNASINWNLAGAGNISKISTKKADNSLIQNNGSSVEFLEIDSANIYDRLLDDWILEDIYGADGDYSGDFKHPDSVSSPRDNNPIPFDRLLTEWYRKYIYLDKNKTGFKPDPRVRFEVVHNDNQLLYDPDFNFVEDYKTEPIWDLGGVQESRINNGFSYFRPAMIYNARAFNARLIGNVLHFDNSVDLEDYTKGFLKIKDANGNWSWDQYLRITRRTKPTNVTTTSTIGVDVSNDLTSQEEYSNRSTSDVSTDYTRTTTDSAESRVSGLENISNNIDESTSRASEQGFFAIAPTISLNVSTNPENFVEGVYKVIDVSGYSHADGYYQNCVYLEVDPNLFLDGYENVNLEVEVFTQNRGIILPYFYNMKSRSLESEWIQNRFTEDGVDYTELRTANIRNYKDYGPRLSIVMEPIFHNYAFNGFQQYQQSRSPQNKRDYTNRDIFKVRLIKIVPSGDTFVHNPYYRIIFNNLYRDRNNAIRRSAILSPGGQTCEEPIIGAYAYDTPDMPNVFDQSYYVDPSDILESFGYNDDMSNWISILENVVPYNNSSVYNNFLAGDMFTGTWKVSNSGLTSESNYYGVYSEPDIGHINVDVDRLYFDIVDNRLDINGSETTNKIYPALRNSQSASQMKDDPILITTLFPPILNIGGTQEYDYGVPSAAHTTNNILNYTSSMNSDNYTRYSTDFFNGELISGTSYTVSQIRSELELNSDSSGRSDLQYMTSTSHTEFRLASNMSMSVAGVTPVPSDFLPTNAIRFPDTTTVNGTKHGGIWFKMDNFSGVFERFRNDIDRHYLLKIKIIRRIVKTSASVARPVDNNKVSVIIDDQKYDKYFGIDSTTSGLIFETLEFNIYHYIEAGDEWDPNTLVGVILEHKEFGSNWTREYYITQFTWEYDPLQYIDLFATIEPQVECAGKIVKLYSRYSETTTGVIGSGTVSREKTISTKILDYDWINKSYIFDVENGDAFFNGGTEISKQSFYVATNMRITNRFDHDNLINTDATNDDYDKYNNNLLTGYDGFDFWVLPPWNATSVNLSSDLSKYEVIYQRDKVNDFTTKDCMMRIKYLTHSSYVEGSGEGEIEGYHDSLGDYPTNNPVRYNIINNTGVIKDVMTSLINPTYYDYLGVEYYNYGTIGSYSVLYDPTLGAVVSEEEAGLSTAFVGAQGIDRQIDDEQTSQSTTQASSTESMLLDIDGSKPSVNYKDLANGLGLQVLDNGNYWVGPWTSSYGATVKDSQIEDSEHPAYDEGCFWKRDQILLSNSTTASTIYGFYDGNEPMLDTYSNSLYKYIYTYYQNGVFSGTDVVSVSNPYPLYGGLNSPWNFEHMRGWGHISRWNWASLDGWISGSFEGLSDRESEYVDFFMTRPTNVSSLQNINANDGVAIFINQPNVDLISGVDLRRRNVIKKVEVIEKLNATDFNTEYPDYQVDGYDGMSKFGLQMYKQNNLFRIMSHNYDFSYLGYKPRNNVVWYYGDVDFSERHNFHDIALFNSYHVANIDDDEYQSVLFDGQGTWNNNVPNKMMYNMFSDMKNGTTTNANQYVPYFTDNIKSNFEKWNLYHQTSVQNFNLFSGIQLYTPNVSVDPTTYQDNWYNGTFYNGTFKGEWWGGNWINGNWDGFNHALEIDYDSSAITYNFQSAFTITVLHPPNTINIGYVDRETYEINYGFLKKKKLYYEIAPWDEANKKATEVVKLPLRKKERRR